MLGVNANTVRLYEDIGLIPTPEREASGYRVYTELQLLGLQLLRTALKAKIPSGNLRKKAIDIVKTSVARDFDAAIQKTLSYRIHIEIEIDNANVAIRSAEEMMRGGCDGKNAFSSIGRREAAVQTGVSYDVLRAWERNCLIEVPRRGNRREYGAAELNRLKIIAVLRNAGYSQAAILRMMGRAENGNLEGLITIIDTPEPDDIISAIGRYIASLTGALADAGEMLRQLSAMKDMGL